MFRGPPCPTLCRSWTASGVYQGQPVEMPRTGSRVVNPQQRNMYWSRSEFPHQRNMYEANCHKAKELRDRIKETNGCKILICASIWKIQKPTCRIFCGNCLTGRVTSIQPLVGWYYILNVVSWIFINILSLPSPQQWDNPNFVSLSVSN